jgi:hypothetical protein
MRNGQFVDYEQRTKMMLMLYFVTYIVLGCCKFVNTVLSGGLSIYA